MTMGTLVVERLAALRPHLVGVFGRHEDDGHIARIGLGTAARPPPRRLLLRRLRRIGRARDAALEGLGVLDLEGELLGDGVGEGRLRPCRTRG